MRKQPANVYGEKLTLMGRVDKRYSREVKQENDGEAYQTFDVVEQTGTRPFVLYSTTVGTKVRTLVSRHANRFTAEKAMERLRIKQPNRKGSDKLRHKLR